MKEKIAYSKPPGKGLDTDGLIEKILGGDPLERTWRYECIAGWQASMIPSILFLSR